MPRLSFAALTLICFAIGAQDAWSIDNITNSNVDTDTADSRPAPDPLKLASAVKKAGDPKDAVNILRKALAKDPDNTDLMKKLGMALIAANQPVDAVAIFDQWIALKPDAAMAYNGKAMAFDHTGNHLAAQDLYQQALKLEPDSLAIQNNLAMSMILNGQYDQAILLLEKLNMQNDNKTVRQNLALAYGLKGDKEKALELNLQDMPKEQAEENARFYEAYAGKLTPKPSPATVGFADTSEKQKEKLEAKQAAAKALAEKKAHEAVKDNDQKADLSPAAGDDSSIFGKDVVYSFPSQGRH